LNIIRISLLLVVLSVPWSNGAAASPNVVELNLNVADRIELSYIETREIKKWRYDEIERSIKLEIPVKCEIIPHKDKYTLKWEYGVAEITELYDSASETVSKEILSQIQNIASKFGTLEIGTDLNGLLVRVHNLSDIRRTISTQYEAIAKEMSDNDDAEKHLLLKAVTVVKNLSDEELNQAILKDIQPYFQFYGKVFGNRSLNINELNDPHPGYNKYKVRLVSEIETNNSDSDIRLTRYQTDILDEKGSERELEKYEPVVTWLTKMVFDSSSNIIKTYEDTRNLTSQNKSLRGQVTRKLLLTPSGLAK